MFSSTNTVTSLFRSLWPSPEGNVNSEVPHYIYIYIYIYIYMVDSQNMGAIGSPRRVIKMCHDRIHILGTYTKYFWASEPKFTQVSLKSLSRKDLKYKYDFMMLPYVCNYIFSQ